MELKDGHKYWLGATHGVYDAESRSFLMGNCFVPLYQTIFSKDKDNDPSAIAVRKHPDNQID